MAAARRSRTRAKRSGSARRLREEGQVVHLIADHSQMMRKKIADEGWISGGCRRGRGLLTKDRRIRYRAQELTALRTAFSRLADGNAIVDTISATLLRARP